MVSKDPAGLKAAIGEIVPEVAWQRCVDDCLIELRWFYNRRDIEEVRRKTSEPALSHETRVDSDSRSIM